MSEVWVVAGPPGCGKTHYLGVQSERAAEKHGKHAVAIASLTRTAAAEIGGRVGIPAENCATLHAHAYRGLDRPDLAETPEGLRAWADAHPSLALSGGARRLEDAPDAGESGRSRADELHAQVAGHRARLTPEAQWTDEQREWHKQWTDWKTQTHRLDFTDLIATALDELPTHPANPKVLLLDEAQDFSALEMRLALQWAQGTQTTVIVGDDDQALYTWRGSDAGQLNAIHATGRRALEQSHRVPVAVHRAATRWINQLAGRRPVTYHPTSVQGEVAAAPYGISSERLLDAIHADIEAGLDVMVLTTCGYMLTPLLRELRAQGVPFHNPYRCSPADEPILTTTGWVAIGELDPSVHRLAGFYGSANVLSWGGRSGPRRAVAERGFGFRVASRPYSGPMLTLTTESSRTRVTPNHRVRVRFTEKFADKWVVYLMRRGDQWRIGRTKGSNGVSSRLTTEGGDGAWIVALRDTKREAGLEEMRLQAAYGITGATFRAWRDEYDQGSLDVLHAALAVAGSGDRARRLLADRGLLEEHPLYRLERTEGGKRVRVSARSLDGFETVAANVIPGLMRLPIPPEAFLEPSCNRIAPEWKTVDVEREHFEGDVYSLDVPGPEHYISGGAAVHNSTQGAWNPLRSASRLLAFLRPVEAAWGEQARNWTWGDLRQWTEPLQASCLARGAKALIERHCQRDQFGQDRSGEEAPLEVVLELLGVGGLELDHPALRLDTQWWRDNLRAPKRKSAEYPLEVMRRHWAGALRETPRICVGTVHSVKGGEAASVYLDPTLSKQGYYHGWQAGGPGRDAIVRLMYVALTRASRKVTLLQRSEGEHVYNELRAVIG